MATAKPQIGSRTSLPYTGSALSTLANATYVQNTTAYPGNTNQPYDIIIEVDVATTNAPSGSNPGVYVFARTSLDGTNYTSGPTSGTTTTDELNLKYLGFVPVASSSTTEIGQFSILGSLGFVPYSFFIVLKNSVGVALTSGTVWTSEITMTIA